MNNTHGHPSPTTTGNNEDTPHPQQQWYKHQELVELGDKTAMIWHLVVSINTLKPCMHTVDDTKRYLRAVERALDFASNARGDTDTFLLVNPSTKKYHYPNSVASTESFDLTQYSNTNLTQSSSTRFELHFAIMSLREHLWTELLPVPELQKACQTFRGKCFPDPFHGDSNQLLGIITEVDLSVFPRDAVERHLEQAYYDQKTMSTKFKLRKSTMRYKSGDTSHATDIIQIYGTQDDKFKALGFLSAFFLKNELRSHGFNRAAFTPMNMLAGSTNSVHRSQCLSAHQKFLNDHKAILLRGVSLTDWEEDATPELCKEVLSQKAYVEDKLKSNSIYDLFFNYLVDMRTGPVALGAYNTPGGSTTLFIVVPNKKVNNTFEALNQVSLSQYRNFFFSEPIHSFLPSACHAYLSKGTTKASRQEITNREYSRRINLEKEFPSFTIKKKPKHPPTPSQHSAPTRKKTYASATTSKAAPVPTQQQYYQPDPKLTEMSAENE